jgi:hypothetical protein
MALRLCTDNISAAILSTCAEAISGGLEPVAYIMARNEVTITFDATANSSKITSIVKVAGNVGYKITGIKKMLNAMSEIVITENRPDRYKHKFVFEQFQYDVANIENVSSIDDAVVVVELKDKAGATGNGVFVVLGAKFGLFKSSDTWNTNENNGARLVELASMDGQEEPYERYVLLATDYATTVTMLTTLITP